MTEPARPPDEPAGNPGAPDRAPGPSEPSGWARPDPTGQPGSPAAFPDPGTAPASSPQWGAPIPSVPGGGTPPPPAPSSGPTGGYGAPTGWGQPPAGHAPAWGAAPGRSVPPPPTDDQRRPPKRVEQVPGTPFGVVYLDVPPVTSGLAVGALVAGIASLLVALLVTCFGVAFSNYGGAWASGAFAVLGVLAGVAAVVAGLLGQRQIRRPAPPPAVRFTGRGLAVAGISCGAGGALLSLLGLGLALVISLA